MKIFKPIIEDLATFSGSVDITGSLTVTQNVEIHGDITASGNIIPSVSGAYDLGTAQLPFRDIYVSQNSLKFISTDTGEEIGRISVNKNTGDIKLLNTKRLTPEQRKTLTAETADETALSPVSASALYVSESINPGHTNTSIGHNSQKFHTLHVHFVSASSSTISGSLHVGETVIANTFTGSFVGDGTRLTGVTSYTDSDTLDYINTVGVISSSAQIASDISGSFTSVSASLASSIAGISTDFTDITNKPTLISGSNQLAGQTIEGDLTLTGALTAQTIHVQQVTSSIVYSSGSNVFGSSAGDLQQFTGSLSITGNVSTLGTLTASGYNSTNWDSAFSWGNHASAGYLTSFTETDPTVPSHVKAITTTKISNWDTAFGWGNHASAGYLTSVTNISGYSGELIRTDNRTIAPNELSSGRMSFGFTSWNNNNGSPYADFIHLRSYTDGSGGNDNLVTFLKSGIGMRIWQQSYGSATAYSSYADVITTNNDDQTKSGYLQSNSSLRAPIFYDSNNTAYYIDPAGQSRLGNIERLAHNTGFLVGSYNTAGANSDKTNPIYSIGNNYKPDVSTLSNFYGIGYAHPNASFISFTGASGWGMYVAADGDARVYLDGSSGTVSATGDVVAYASDGRLKTNVKGIDNALEKVKSIRGVSYDWVDNIKDEYDFHPSKMHEVGVIAQEIQKVLPEVVHTAPFNSVYTQKTGWSKIQKQLEKKFNRPVPKKEAKLEYEKLSLEERESLQEDHNFLTVNYERIIPLLIEAIKEQQVQIEEFKQLIKKQ